MSESRRMDPADVPDELVGMACGAAYGGVWAFSDDRYLVSRALAAALPEHEKQVRERIASEIEAYVDSRAALGWAKNLQAVARQIAADIRRGES